MLNEKNNAMGGQELVGGTSKKQNWKGLGIAFVVITVICLLILAAIFATRGRSSSPLPDLIPLSEQDIFNIKIPRPWNGTWISDTTFFYLDTNDSIYTYNCDTLKEELLIKKSIVQHDLINQSFVSPTAKYVLIPKTQEKMHRFYTEYEFDLYEKVKKIASIGLPNGQVVPISAVLYSNTDNYFAFVHNFNIFIYDISRTDSIQVTFDGNRETVHNGLIEWVYEYEIFKQNVLLYWSPNNRYLAFIKTNLRNVSLSHFLRYDFKNKDNDLYSIPYPKYGETLPIFDVYVYNIESGKTQRIPRPAEYERLVSGFYIYHVVWYYDTCFAVVYGNRGQNSSIIQLYDIQSRNQDNIVFKSRFVEETRKGFLLPRFLKPYFSPMGVYGFIVRFESSINDKSTIKARPCIARIHFDQAHPQIDTRSPSNIYVDEIIHVDSYNQIYFTGSNINNPLEQQVYRLNYMNDKVEAECISCQQGNDSCGFANAKFSTGKGSYYVLECYGPTIPFSTLYNQTEKLALINENHPFREWISNRLMPYVDYFSVPLDKKNTVGYGMIILPPNYNPNVTIASYPVIVSINDQLYDRRVTKKYVLPLVEFAQVTQDNISIVFFDSHGSTGQDEDYLKTQSPNWFERQYDDYIKVAQHLKWNEKKFNGTLNDTRFGLKARGPAAAIALKLLEDPNKDEYICAFLESPVNDLTHYHAVYTERINGVKRDFKTSRKSSLLNKSIAIVHGTADEDVHFKHSAALAKTFINTQIKKFQYKVYPDADHDFEKHPTLHDDYYYFQRHFFQECLGGRVTKERKLIISEEYE